MTVVGRNIRARRLALGLSGAELARRVGYKSGSQEMWRVESGRATPSLKRLRAIAAELKCSVTELVSETDYYKLLESFP